MSQSQRIERTPMQKGFLAMGVTFVSLMIGSHLWFVSSNNEQIAPAKFGCIDREGNIVIPPTFDRIYPFSEGLAAFCDGDVMGYIDTNGRVVIPPAYEHAFPFSDGLAVVCLEGKWKWGCVDRDGQMVIPACFDDLDSFRDGMATAKINGRYGCIDPNGTYVIPPDYSASIFFAEGLACVQMDDGMFEYIDRFGNSAIDDNFEGAKNFSSGLAGVLIDGKWGFIDTTGTIVIEPRFEKVLGDFNEGIAIVMFGTDTYAIDTNGKIAWPIASGKTESWLPSFKEGLALQWFKRKTYTYIDPNGKTVLELPQAESAGGFYEGLAVVEVGGKCGYINHEGEFVIEPRFLSAEKFSEGLASVKISLGD